MKQLFLIILFSFSVFNLFSQKLIKDTVKLEEVTVTAVKPPEKDKSVVPMQSVTRVELDRI